MRSFQFGIEASAILLRTIDDCYFAISFPNRTEPNIEFSIWTVTDRWAVEKLCSFRFRCWKNVRNIPYELSIKGMSLQRYFPVSGIRFHLSEKPDTVSAVCCLPTCRKGSRLNHLFQFRWCENQSHFLCFIISFLPKFIAAHAHHKYCGKLDWNSNLQRSSLLVVETVEMARNTYVGFEWVNK